MNTKGSKVWFLLFSLGLIMAMVRCSPAPPDQPTPTPTPTLTPTASLTATPTEVAISMNEDKATDTPTPPPTPTLTPTTSPTPTPTPNPCQSLSGDIEVKILMGPADAVGLEPYTVGSVPFIVTDGQVNGGGDLTYQDTLVKEWGTYEVFFDADITLEGECENNPSGAVLDVTFTMAGSQNVVVTVKGSRQEYPWSGENTQEVAFLVADGDTVSGEGWSLILHLHDPSDPS